MTPFVVGIAGGSASGKTELAQTIASQLRGTVAMISQDWYYHDRSMLSEREKRALNFDQPDAFDNALLRKQLLELKAGRAVRAPRYDYATHRRSVDGVWLRPAAVVLLEGLLVLHEPALRGLLDLSVFVDVPADVRLIRRLRRDVAGRGIPMEETLRLYECFVRSMHDKFVQPSAQRATVVWSQEQDPGFSVRLVRRINELCSEARSLSSVVSHASVDLTLLSHADP